MDTSLQTSSSAATPVMPHHAPSVTPTVSSKKGKQLIPWREPAKGYILRSSMYRLAIVERIYFKHADDKRKVDDRWLDFANKLFAQPEFLGMEGSFRTVKDQFYLTLNERAKHHGWMDANGGTTGNLSNHAGELDALDQLIKNCMMDKEQLESEKQLAKDLTKELNGNENAIIQGQLAKEAKESRKDNTLKYKTVSADSNSSSTSSPSTLDNDQSSATNSSKPRRQRMSSNARLGRAHRLE